MHPDDIGLASASIYQDAPDTVLHVSDQSLSLFDADHQLHKKKMVCPLSLTFSPKLGVQISRCQHDNEGWKHIV